MDDSVPRKYSADKIALLGLLVISLLAARLLTGARTIRPLKAGSQQIARLKSEGLDSILDKQDWELYFLIRDTEGKLVGFSSETFERAPTDSEAAITSNGHFYRRIPYFQQSLVWFECDNSLDSFRLEGQSRMAGARPILIEVALDKAGKVTAKSSDSDPQLTFQAEQGSVPEYLIERIAVEATLGTEANVVLNVIGNDGTKDVVVVSTKKTPARQSRMGGTGRTVEIHSPEKQYTIQVVLDSADRIVRIQHEGVFILERAAREDIIRRFGEGVRFVPDRNDLPAPDAI